jgi:hypothetical protein
VKITSGIEVVINNACSQRRRKQSRAGGAASQKRAICFTDKQAKKSLNLENRLSLLNL